MIIEWCNNHDISVGGLIVSYTHACVKLKNIFAFFCFPKNAKEGVFNSISTHSSIYQILNVMKRLIIYNTNEIMKQISSQVSNGIMYNRVFSPCGIKIHTYFSNKSSLK